MRILQKIVHSKKNIFLMPNVEDHLRRQWRTSCIVHELLLVLLIKGKPVAILLVAKVE